MPSIADSMHRIILSLSLQQHEELKTEVEEVMSFISEKNKETDRGKWWQNEEQSQTARSKMKVSAAKRWGLVKVTSRSMKESLYFNNYEEVAGFLGKTPKAVASKVFRANSTGKAATFLLGDDIITIERVPCVEN
jgi:hypothetical protein